MITQGELRIKTVVPISGIQQFRMEVCGGSHTVIFVKGTVDEEIGSAFLFQPMEQESITVSGGQEQLFAGNIREIKIIREGNVYQISLKGISATDRLDDRKKNRTFQDTDKTYGEVMRETVADTKGASIQLFAQDRKVGAPLYQIEETDWEFINRLASHLGIRVFSDTSSTNPIAAVGLPHGKKHRDIQGVLCENVWMDRKRNSIFRNIRSYENWEIGDEISYEEKDYTILEKSCRLEGGVLYFRYMIAKREAFAAERYDNPPSAGVLLPATVLDRKEEQIKVQFDIDASQPVSTAYWYPWRPDVGNAMYCMPEKGEKVYMHLGDGEGKQARAVCAVHGNGTGNPEMSGIDRYFTTADKKRMYLVPDSVGFRDLAQDGPLEIGLRDDTGMDAKSNRQIVLSAKDTIGLKGKKLFFQAPKEISIVRKDESSPTLINMCNGFDSVGATNEVVMGGAGGAEFPVFHTSKQEEGKKCNLSAVQKGIIASTPGVGFASEIDRQIEGMKVDKIMEKAETGTGIERMRTRKAGV